MARVAVVSGGSRGIGAAVSAALKAAGYHVAATYHGNDAAAAKFKAETGIATYKWDVSNYKECAEGLKKVEADLGPIDILVNNAGITRDTPFHRNLGFDVVRLSGRGIHRRDSRTITVINRWKRRRLHEYQLIDVHDHTKFVREWRHKPTASCNLPLDDEEVTN